MEAKYTKTLEEKILLEHELLEKASLEEEMQRLKDEFRGEYKSCHPSALA
jgi:nuclear distribution protein NudE